jgi:hypothetical protein
MLWAKAVTKILHADRIWTGRSNRWPQRRHFIELAGQFRFCNAETLPIEGHHPMELQRCGKRRVNGLPYQKPVIPGGSICRLHGDAATQVVAAAKLRLAPAADAVAERLVRSSSSKRTKDADVIAATKDLLDRAGVRREPDGRTPLSRKELMALHAEMKQQQISTVRETYRTMWEMSKMFGDAPPPPWVIQTRVQA